jgi:hypothetical protein
MFLLFGIEIETNGGHGVDGLSSSGSDCPISCFVNKYFINITNKINGDDIINIIAQNNITIGYSFSLSINFSFSYYYS